MRIDKMTLAALEATLRQFLDLDRAAAGIPTLAAITLDEKRLRARASRLASVLKKHFAAQFEVTTRVDASRVGGGASPEVALKTWLVCLHPRQGLHQDQLRHELLQTDPPVVGRVEENALCLDPRTLLKGETGLIVKALQQALGNKEALNSH